MRFLAKALNELRPNEPMTYNSGSPIIADNISYESENTIRITQNELDAKLAELQAEHEANEYQRQRAAEYPSWQDQLDKIYHDGVMAWQQEIKAIKDKYPKS